MSKRTVARNSDRERRRRSREAPSDPEGLARWIRERMRQGEISKTRAQQARWFCWPMSPPGSGWGRSAELNYEWYPIGWTLDGSGAPAGPEVTPALEAQLAQDPRTGLTFEALNMVLGKPRLPPAPFIHGGPDLPKSAEAWSLRNAFFVSDTMGAPGHPPFEIQYDQNLERDSVGEEDRAEVRQLEIMIDYAAHVGAIDPPPADANVYSYQGLLGYRGIPGDFAYQWFVRSQAMEGNRNALSILRWLRVNSTLEYCYVLGAEIDDPRDEPIFGRNEFALVSSLLGGLPL